jgi:hypothetical protein
MRRVSLPEDSDGKGTQFSSYRSRFPRPETMEYDRTGHAFTSSEFEHLMRDHSRLRFDHVISLHLTRRAR